MATRLSFDEPEEACEFCGNNEYDISATLIKCTRCGVTHGRCEGVWCIDSTTIPEINEACERTGAG